MSQGTWFSAVTDDDVSSYYDVTSLTPSKLCFADEMFLQFNEDGSLQIGGRNEKGEAVAFPMDPDEKYTYTVKDLVVTVLNNGKDEGAITFSSHEPKAGDEVSLTENDSDKVTTKITKVEPATKLKAMEFELPPDTNSKPKEAEAPEEKK